MECKGLKIAERSRKPKNRNSETKVILKPEGPNPKRNERNLLDHEHELEEENHVYIP
jgi:hypothetical protein